MEHEANERSFAQPERCCAVSATTVSCVLMIERGTAVEGFTPSSWKSY